MRRFWPFLILLAALIAILALFVLPDDDDGLDDGDALDRAEEEALEYPALRGLPASEREAYLQRQRLEEERRAAAEAAKEQPAAGDERQLVEGTVVSAEEGAPMKGVLVWWELAKEPCPRMSAPFYNDAFVGEDKPNNTGAVQVHTNAQGTFRLRLGQPSPRTDPGDPPTSIDVFAYAPGRILHTTCAVAVPGRIEIRLEQGLSLEGRVQNTRGRAVAEAEIRARPAPETPNTPGHSTPFVAPRSDEEGRFEIGGLVAGDVLLDVDHLHHMPKTVGPFDPADREPIDIELVPAFRATFQLRTDDGRLPEHPTLIWRTTETPPRGDVLLLRTSSITTSVTPERQESEWTSQTVRLPCDAPSVVFQVKADGYGTWVSEPLRLPPEGGSETFEVKLTGDYATGKVQVALEDDSGQTVHFAGAAVDVVVTRLDQGTGDAAFVLDQKERLTITDLPAGAYRLALRSAQFAPAEVDVVVTAGQLAETLVRVRQPARLKVRFLAPVETLVRFRLTQGGTVVHGVPEGAFSRGTDETTGEPILTAGADGIVLSGLAAGSYHVEVLSEELTAPATLVHLTEGDTEEVEIHVSPR